MTARSEVTPEEIERLLPAYRRLLRMARENQAAAETPTKKVRAVDIPPESTAASSHPSTDDAPLTNGAPRRA
jgi:hypothetical protein